MDVGRLLEVLGEARDRGFLGPGPIEVHVDHALTLAELVGDPPAKFLDLGSGGGIPGLVLAQRWPDAEALLIDAGERRCEFLVEALGRLELGQRVQVRCGRAEELAREPALRAAFPLVVARGFGAPPVVAECSVGFLVESGRLVVTEPPAGDAHLEDRWPVAGLGALGFTAPRSLRNGDVGVVVLQAMGAPDERWPRRVGIPRKRPLW